MRPTAGDASSLGGFAVDAQRAAGHVFLQLGQTRFRNRERDRDRRDLIDHDERRLVVGANQVALVHHQRAGASGDRRGDGRVLQLHLRVLHRRFVGIHGRISAATVGLRRIHLLARRDAALRQLLEPLGLLRRVGGLREIAIEVGLRLLQRRFERTPIEREQDLPGRDVIAFGEVDARSAGRWSGRESRRSRPARPRR